MTSLEKFTPTLESSLDTGKVIEVSEPLANAVSAIFIVTFLVLAGIIVRGVGEWMRRK